jgi:hypothetical protein
MSAPITLRILLAAAVLLILVALAAAQQWQPATASGKQPFWNLTGNGGTVPGAQFLGTTDSKSLVIKTAGVERMRLRDNGNVGIGTAFPGEKLHIGDGNILVEGGGETALLFKRDFTFNGISGASTNPIFKLGRVNGAGDGDPELRVLYSDDATAERAVFEFDRKGIVASVKPEVGSHFEGFVAGEPEPLFRLNSFPAMQLEMGPGGATPTDIAIRREAAETMTLRTGGSERVRIDGSGRVGIGTASPQSALQVVGSYVQIPAISGAPPAADCDAAAEAGRIVVRTDGPPDLYICRGTSGWVGK